MKYLAFFRMKFVNGLQYRAAAAAGLATQFVWGTMEILLFKAFYEGNPSSFPMEFQALASYIWLQQAFLSMYMLWVYENDIFGTITDGGVVYEMCRPLDLYNMWFARSMANRLSKAVLRCIPVLVLAACLKKPYGIGLPYGESLLLKFGTLFCFLFSFFLAFLNVVALTMLVYILAFYTIRADGIKILMASLTEFLSGATIPLPFLPDGIREAVELLPFASIQNVPFRIYGGDLAGMEIFQKMILQVFWAAVLITTGKLLTKKAVKRIIVQGG